MFDFDSISVNKHTVERALSLPSRAKLQNLRKERERRSLARCLASSLQCRVFQILKRAKSDSKSKVCFFLVLCVCKCVYVISRY